MVDRFSCPPFISNAIYQQLISQGWEYVKKTKSFHFNILCGEFDCFGFDVYVEEEFPLKMTLYCMECDFTNGCEDSEEIKMNGFNEMGMEILAAEKLLEITKPYLTRAFDHGY